MSESFTPIKRNAAYFDRAAVIRAMQHLQDIKRGIRRLNRINKNRNDLSQSATIRNLKKERSYLVLGFTAYQEAAWRLLAGQRVKEKEKGVFDIYDRLYKQYVPLDQPLGRLPELNLYDDDKLDSISLKPGHKILMTNQLEGVPDQIMVVTEPLKSKSNKLTYEQRKEYGVQGAAVRDENKRKRLAFDSNAFHVYAKRENKVERVGAYYKEMKGAFNFIRRSHEKDSLSDYFVYDNKGQRWDLDKNIFNMTLKH